MPAYIDDITRAHRWFTNTDQVFTLTVYAATASDEDVKAGTASTDNITGYALSWLVKHRQTDSDANAVLIKTTGGGGIVFTAPLTGVCQVTVTNDDTKSLTPRNYWHELKRTDAGSERVLCQGNALLQGALHKL